MSKITEIFGSFASEEQKEQFMAAQLQTITNLTKQVEQLKREKKHLEELLKKAPLPNLEPADKQQEERSYQEQICIDQLKMLNGISKDRELTAEEARKVEIYSKILLAGRDQNKKKRSAVDEMSTEELLKLVETDAKEDKH